MASQSYIEYFLDFGVETISQNVVGPNERTYFPPPLYRLDWRQLVTKL